MINYSMAEPLLKLCVNDLNETTRWVITYLQGEMSVHSKFHFPGKKFTPYKE